jgi:hypothetical protein
MARAYVIYGYEWFTNEKGAAPEVCRYKVLQIDYEEHEDLKMAIHSDFTFWKSLTREKVWKEVYKAFDFNEMTPDALSNLIKDFDTHSIVHWYILDEDEFNEWVHWGEDHSEVEIAALSFGE